MQPVTAVQAGRVGNGRGGSGSRYTQSPKPAMRWPLLLLGLLTEMAAVVFAAAVIGEPPVALGVENATF